jgi:D-glycero-D-manno-heptose 1,7-bisphosphate phosphatase
MADSLIILDRVVVINLDSESFVRSPDEWLPIDGSIEAIAQLSAAGFEVAVLTNQSGVGRKLIDLPALKAIHTKMQRLVREAGGVIARIIFCPHHPDDGCDCRKPGIGMFLQLGRELGVPLDGVPMVGDSERDIVAARAVGGRPILVRTGNGFSTFAALAGDPDEPETFDDLAAAASFLIDESRQ